MVLIKVSNVCWFLFKVCIMSGEVSFKIDIFWIKLKYEIGIIFWIRSW